MTLERKIRFVVAFCAMTTFFILLFTAAPFVMRFPFGVLWVVLSDDVWKFVRRSGVHRRRKGV